MATSVIMPRQGQSVESCIITKWHKKPGDQVSAGDILFSYETDKAAFDEEAKASGTLLALFCQEGDDVPCLSAVAVIGEAGEDISALAPDGGHAQAPAKAPAQAASESAWPAQNASPLLDAQRLFVSPRARALASQMGLNPADADATGPNGRVIERDIRSLQTIPAEERGIKTAAHAAASSPAEAPAPAYEDAKLSNVRKIIGKSMMESLSSMAQLTLHASFDAGAMNAMRKTFKAAQETLDMPNITLNDMILFAVSRVIKGHRDLNAHFLGDRIRYFEHVHLGMAVDTARGLLVPTLFDADSLTLSELARQAKALAKAAQESTISPELLKDASFTVTNLGGLGVEMFTPVINPPQTAILGVGNMVWRMREAGDKVVPYQAMGLSLTFDHRALDGAPAARFLQALCAALENFTAIMAK